MTGPLREKQRQFNAAMARYTSVRGYAWFGHGVATANLLLQGWLLWRLRVFNLGAGAELLALFLAWPLADFVNGLVHMYMDGNDRYDSPAGPLIANFHLHHKTPIYRKRSLPLVYFCESSSKVWLVPCLVLIAGLAEIDAFPPLLLHILVYFGVLSSVAEISHYLCHTSSSPLAAFLGDCGILLGKRHHAVHHQRDNIRYAFLNGMTDPLLDRIAARFAPGYKTRTDLHYTTWDVETADR